MLNIKYGLRTCDVREENFRKDAKVPLAIQLEMGRYRAHAQPVGSFNQLAKKLVALLVASLKRTHGKRRLARNPFCSACF